MNATPGYSRLARRSGERGITLIELMIVLAIIGTMVVISIPAYRGYSERAQRVEALKDMERLHLQQERFRLANNTFTSDLDALGFAGGCTENCVYDISFDLVNAQTYVARLVPREGGGTNGVSQTSDEDCSWFTIDALGRRAAENAKCLEGR
jgi:prepilin-type N-terminal cleavage/methylation domain-containing protein